MSETVIVCEDGMMELRCSVGKLKINTAVYGRTEGRNVCPHKNINKTDCKSTSSDTVVRNKCDGESSCSITVSNSVFGGDPCPNTYKYLDVTFTCVVE